MTFEQIGAARPLPALLNTVQAAAYLNLSKSFLDKARVRGDGPPFNRLGRSVRYRTDALNGWVAGLERRSTSEQRFAA